MRRGGASTPATVKSADRVMAILDLLSERGSSSFREIAQSLELPKSSAHALLQTMLARGFVTVDSATETYRIGTRVWAIAQSCGGIEDLLTSLKPGMDGVMRRTLETVQLAALDGLSAVYLGLSESPHAMKLTSRAGARLPAHSSAIGKALLASLDPQEAESRLAGATLVALTEHTITDPLELVEELGRIRQRGYSVDNEEFAIGLRCIAMPVRDLDEQPVCAISVSMPTPRYNAAAAANAREALADAVDAAKSLLGRRAH
jgi:DNA-binding IclR family transcriptional regulator